MTNDAPEHIVLLPSDGWSWTTWPISRQEDAIKYTRADHAQAELQAAVAAEREAIIQLIRNDYPLSLVEDIRCEILIDEIRAQGETDTLAARDAQVRAEALKEVAALRTQIHRLAAAGENLIAGVDARNVRKWDKAREEAFRTLAEGAGPDQNKVDG